MIGEDGPGEVGDGEAGVGGAEVGGRGRRARPGLNAKVAGGRPPVEAASPAGPIEPAGQERVDAVR